MHLDSEPRSIRLVSLISICAISCLYAACLATIATKPNPYYFTITPCAIELVERFVHGDAIDKPGTAVILSQGRCKQVVPYLLAEVRQTYGRIWCEPRSNRTRYPPDNCYFMKDGQATLIDYYDPILGALSSLTVSLYVHEGEWSDAVESWLASNPQKPLPISTASPYMPSYIGPGCSQELIDRLLVIDPIDKMGSANLLRQRQCRESVPVLLAEMRDNYGPIVHDEPPPGREFGPSYVIRNGERLPYIDYHTPIFQALWVLSVPYTGPDEKWYREIDEWIEAHLKEKD